MAIRMIVFEFDGDSIFGNYRDVQRLDIEASANRFSRLCKKAIQNEYPEADIDVLFEYDPEHDELLPRSRTLFVDGETDSLEAGNIESIIERVYNQGSWMLQPHRLTIADAALRSGVPEVYIQWMCEHGLISGAINTSGVWELTQLAVSDHLLATVPRTEDVIVMRAVHAENGILQIKFEPILIMESDLADLLLGADILVVQSSESYGPAFLQTNSRFVISTDEDQVEIRVEHFHTENDWHGKWRYEPFAIEFLRQAKQRNIESGVDRRADSPGAGVNSIWLKISRSYEPRLRPSQMLKQVSTILFDLTEVTELSLAGGRAWKPEYESNERLFCVDLLKPLLTQLGFTDVNYRGGRKEYGKDFTFSEQTAFGDYRHFGLQAKDGDMSGRVNSQIDEIVGQLDDAFSMPYLEGDSREERYIAHFIVAISGHYTENAEEKIRQKVMLRGRAGSVSFWNKTKIQWLIRKAWLG